MKETLSIVSDCELGRIDDFLVIRDDGEVVKIPIGKILDIEIYSEVEFNTGVLKFLHKNEVGIMFYDDKGMKSVNYNGLIGVLIESVKQLSSEIDILKAETHRLRQEVKVLNQRR